MTQQPPPEQPEHGWGTPPYGQPPGYGQPPYGQPGYGQPPYWQPPYGNGGWVDPNDPLVPPPNAGLNGWSDRVAGAIRRSWRTLLPIMLLTQSGPALVVGVFSLAAPTGAPGSGLGQPEVGQPPPDLGELFAFIGGLAVLSLGISVVSSIGWAAGAWVMTRQAAGEQVGMSAALRYGLSRALGLWLWTLLAGLLVVVGICACVLPGIYLGFALSMVGPVYLFERVNPIGRSFQIFHGAFGLILGRVALVALVTVGGVVLIEVVGTGLGLSLGMGSGLTAGAVLVTVVGSLIATPLYLVQLVGLVATYTEWRGRQAPVGTAQLVAELG
nr:hypothetical protein [Micromonospora sp. DSM 115978]